MVTPYSRVLLKLSGEALMGQGSYGIEVAMLEKVANQIKRCHEGGTQIAVVIGGGNIFRGLAPSAKNMDRAVADYMGMLATVMNALALQDALKRSAVDTRVMSALTIAAVAEPYIRGKAIRHLEKNRVVVFASGTGNPFFTTDTAAVLRAAEMGAQIVLKATKVDGVYDHDPKTHPDAQRYECLSFDQAIEQKLKVVDATALSLCRDQKMPLRVFSLFKPDALERAIAGANEGTLLTV